MDGGGRDSAQHAADRPCDPEHACTGGRPITAQSSWAQEQQAQANQRGYHHDDAAYRAGQFGVEILLARMLLAVVLGRFVVCVDIEQTVSHAAVDKPEDTGRTEQQKNCVGPAIGDAEHVIGIHHHRNANQNSRDATDDADYQQPQFSAAVLPGVEIFYVWVTPFEVNTRQTSWNQHRQPRNHTHADAQKCQKIVERRRSENGIAGIEQVADANPGDNRSNTAGNQQRESAAMFIVASDILRKLRDRSDYARRFGRSG